MRSDPSRRQMVAASGALLLTAAAVGVQSPPAEVDAKLIRLCAGLAACKAEIDRIDREGSPDDLATQTLAQWRRLADEIIDAPATTPAGLRAKATALRHVLRFNVCQGPGYTVGQDGEQEDIMAWSFLHDVLGEEADWS